MLDQEWVDLIMEAKQQGITIEEIRNFLNLDIQSEEEKKTG